MRLTGGKNEASVMITKLASMLRFSLESIETLVSFERELENVMIYIELQQIRYKDKFSVEWDLDDSIKNCKVLKLLLQPVVENAVYHGILPMDGKGMIKISATVKDRYAVMMVEDNGVGMEKSTLDRLNMIMKSENIMECEHIGIANVNQRIKLFFGEEYSVIIESEQGRGTKVTMPLPIVR